MSKHVILHPYSILEVEFDGKSRKYEIHGVHLGAVQEESMITMRPWSKKGGDLTASGTDLLIVPES